jgi:CobQ-like glutamine amidotransferase family enzyme
MNEKNEILGYYAEDGNIYCVECVNKNKDIMKAIDKAITADDAEEIVYVCAGCKEEIK